MQEIKIAYCAGVIDSDGCITIKRRKNPKNCTSTGYSYAAVVFVRQVEDDAIRMLHKMFGGSICIHEPSIIGGRPLFHWEIACRKASRACRILLPYLRIKRKQASIILEFQLLMNDIKLRRRITWFKPRKNDSTYTPDEAAKLKGILRASIYQMISNGTIPSIKRGRSRLIPKRFWDSYTPSFRRGLPPEYIAIREEIVRRIRKLNGPTRGITAQMRRDS